MSQTFQKPSTHVRRDPWGAWKAESHVDLGHSLRLKFNTSKRSNGALSTTASVCKVEGNFESHLVFQDYHVTLGAFQPRVTEKAVREQHDTLVDTHFFEVIEAVKLHYPELVKQEVSA